jgi:uncharacterized coiled-coil protein SlyX
MTVSINTEINASTAFQLKTIIKMAKTYAKEHQAKDVQVQDSIDFMINKMEAWIAVINEEMAEAIYFDTTDVSDEMSLDEFKDVVAMM